MMKTPHVAARVLAGAVPFLVTAGMLATAASPLNARRADSRTTSESLRAQGQSIFRYDTFGDEQLWTDVLQMPQALASVSPVTALGVGLKVDVDALDPATIAALQAGTVDLTDPGVTAALLRSNAVVGVKGTFDASGALTRVGVTCALCHSTVDDAFATGIGHRLDGWANADLNVGAIVSLSPVLDDATRAAFLSWGPGRYDPRHHAFDGTSIIPLNSPTVPVMIPSIFGLKGVGFETYTADGPVSYWNSYVGVSQMGGHGSFSDSRIGLTIRQSPDLVTPKLPALVAYELSLRAPKAPRASLDDAAVDRGEALFDGKARCATCHLGPNFTDVDAGPVPGVPLLHEATEVGVDPAYALRSATGRYRTTPLRALWQQHAFFHDGSAPDLPAVVDHYDQVFGLGLSASEKADLVEYLKTL